MKDLLEYEDISNVDRSKSLGIAQTILTEGWARRDYPLIQLDSIPWALEKDEYRSWNFYIHSWDMLDSLLKAYSFAKDQSYLLAAVEVALSWLDYESSLRESELSQFTWYDMAVGIRSYRLAYIIDAAQRAGLITPQQYSLLWSSLLKHQQYLSDDENIVFHNNHGFYQAAGQLAMGRRFSSHSEQMLQALQQGRARLLQMLKQQFSSDGVHKEHSPDYHRMVYETLRSVIDSGLVDDPEIVAFADTIEQSLSWFVMPNCHIANFGDSDYRLMSRRPDEAMRKWSTDSMRYRVTSGELGEAPTATNMSFKEGGYFVSYTPNPEKPSDMSACSYLAQTACFHSRTHKHADDLSFIWYDQGANILVDAGRFGYIGKVRRGSALWLDGHWYSDPNRVYCESTRAHNTVEFNGKNYNRRTGATYGSAIKRHLVSESGVIVVETECVQHETIRHRRYLLSMPGRWLIVFDVFNKVLADKPRKGGIKFRLKHMLEKWGARSTPFKAKQWFHLAPELSASLHDGAYKVKSATGADFLSILPLISSSKASEVVVGLDKPMQGWWSVKERDITPNHAINFATSMVKSGCVSALFNFSSNSQVDTKENIVKIDQSEAMFKWFDSRGQHEVALAFDSELTLGYYLT